MQNQCVAFGFWSKLKGLPPHGMVYNRPTVREAFTARIAGGDLSPPDLRRLRDPQHASFQMETPIENRRYFRGTPQRRKPQ